MGMTIRKRVVLPAIATLAVLTAGGGVAWAAFEEERGLSSSQRDRAERAALAEVGSGRVLEAEADDEGGQRFYELEVVDRDGAAWDVLLDEEFEVVLADRDDERDDERDDDRDDDRGDAGEGAGDDDRVGDEPAEDRDGSATDEREDAAVSAADRERVGAAAAAAVQGGKAVDVDRGDRTGIAWEVEVVDGAGRDWDVTLDESLTVVDTVRD